MVVERAKNINGLCTGCLCFWFCRGTKLQLTGYNQVHNLINGSIQLWIAELIIYGQFLTRTEKNSRMRRNKRDYLCQHCNRRLSLSPVEFKTYFLQLTQNILNDQNTESTCVMQFIHKKSFIQSGKRKQNGGISLHNRFCESHTLKLVSWKALRKLNALCALRVYPVFEDEKSNGPDEKSVKWKIA